MSLNSLQDDMSRRAASMAAMAKRARNPQEIQAIQKSLVAGVQSGAIQPYVGIPLIQELTKKMTEAKAQMAQSMAGAGMPQPPQGGAPQQPIAQQIMAQAAQEGQGVETLPSNLPESYAGGGIIAFEEGGPVERYQAGGTSPAGRFFSGLGQNFSETNEAAKLRNKLQMKYGPASALPGLFMTQTDEERQMAKQVAQALPSMSMEQLRALEANGPSALANLAAPTQAVAPTATPAANINQDLGPVPGSTDKDVLGGRSNAAPAAPAAPGGGGIGFKMLGLKTFTPNPAVLPERTLPTKTDFAGFIKDAPKEAQTAFDTARTKEENYLRNLTKPGDEAREKKFNEREAAQDKDSAMGRALNLMSLGFGIAGSKERSLAGALGNEGRQGIADLIRGEAANRVAKERLADARDNFEQQKIAAAKGDRSAANAAGQRAAEDKRAYTQLNMQALQAGSSEATQRYQAEQQGDIGKANVTNQGQQLQMSATDSANRNALGLAGLNLQAQQLAQTGAFQTKQLAAMDKRYDAMDKQSQARMQQVRAKAFSDFNTSVAPQLNAQLTSEYGKNWRTGTDARSLQAQMLFKQQQNSYLMDALGQYDANKAARDSSDL